MFSKLQRLKFVNINYINKRNISILSWNAQGAGGTTWTQIIAYLKNTNIDAALLQECGAPTFATRLPNPKPITTHNGYGTSYYGEVNLGTSTSPLNYYIHFWTNNKSDYQHKLMCLVKSEYASALRDPTILVFKSTTLRPFVGLQTRNLRINNTTNILMLSSHAPSGTGGAAGVENSMMSTIRTKTGLPNWFNAGDFNCTPSTLMANQFWDPNNTMNSSGQPTHAGNKELDYAVSSFAVGPITYSLGDIVANPLDHQSVTFTI